MTCTGNDDHVSDARSKTPSKTPVYIIKTQKNVHQVATQMRQGLQKAQRTNDLHDGLVLLAD